MSLRLAPFLLLLSLGCSTQEPEEPLTAASSVAAGAALYEAGDYPGAEAAYREALLLDGDDGVVLDLLAEALYEQGRHAEALPLLDRAAALRPDLWSVHAHRGMVLAKLGRDAESAESFRQAQRIRPEVAWVQERIDALDP